MTAIIDRLDPYRKNSLGMNPSMMMDSSMMAGSGGLMNPSNGIQFPSANRRYPTGSQMQGIQMEDRIGYMGNNRILTPEIPPGNLIPPSPAIGGGYGGRKLSIALKWAS